jgi:hypothetical protein
MAVASKNRRTIRAEVPLGGWLRTGVSPGLLGHLRAVTPPSTRTWPRDGLRSLVGGAMKIRRALGLGATAMMLLSACDASTGDASAPVCPAAAPLDCGNGKCCPASAPYYCPNDGAPGCGTSPVGPECAGYIVCGGSSGSSGGTSGPCAHWSCGSSSQCVSVLGAPSGVQCQFAPGQTCQQWCQQYVPGNCVCQ